MNGYNETAACGVVFTTSSISSLNSYGYSPHPLSSYIGWIKEILSKSGLVKPFIISITASTSDELTPMISFIQELRSTPNIAPLVAIELNTSCPNVPMVSPSGYIPSSIHPLLTALSDAHKQDKSLTIGLKLPPYTYRAQFEAIIETLREFDLGTFAFLTCTNTLGNSLLFSDQVEETREEPAFGGLAGDALHALALGNVHTFHELLQGEIAIIGVGGFVCAKAGAAVVGAATILGKEGVRAFELLTAA
ncbi:hypothetical protein BDP27DRAFT_1317228 [Rhodocollybia butyracea]|uniref:Dihydroorotate dehydrogenase catalytic domain-containing protein n=1 Tax=Rhodocollybia butyracea TaxID=206335 RepID=A0A9P5UCU6_9AGAR|nr:hypothetical protein BDP27DRAFT_1317228 [Rhodocollybia butyracea]